MEVFMFVLCIISTLCTLVTVVFGYTIVADVVDNYTSLVRTINEKKESVEK